MYTNTIINPNRDVVVQTRAHLPLCWIEVVNAKISHLLVYLYAPTLMGLPVIDRGSKRLDYLCWKKSFRIYLVCSMRCFAHRAVLYNSVRLFCKHLVSPWRGQECLSLDNVAYFMYCLYLFHLSLWRCGVSIIYYNKCKCMYIRTVYSPTPLWRQAGPPVGLFRVFGVLWFYNMSAIHSVFFTSVDLLLLSWNVPFWSLQGAIPERWRRQDCQVWPV